MKTPTTPNQMNSIVPFPVDKMVAPALFMVDYEIGDKVWFVHPKGAWIEGKVVSYFAHITPDDNLKDYTVQGAKPASISNVGYAIEYFVPNPQRQVDFDAPKYIKQIQLQDASEIFKSRDELIKFMCDRNTLKYPEEL